MTMPQPWPTPPPVRARNWPAVTLAALAVVLAAALVVVLTRSGSESGPTYTAAEKAQAKTTLCDRYRLAYRALNVETGPEGDGDIALARISMTNGALILETAAADPALDPRYRDAAKNLAGVYQTTAALATKGMATTQQYQDAVNDSNAKNAVMKELCGE